MKPIEVCKITSIQPQNSLPNVKWKCSISSIHSTKNPKQKKKLKFWRSGEFNPQ